MTSFPALTTPLRDWLTTRALPGRRIEWVRRLDGGHRNHTVLLGMGTGERYVLRRYPAANTCAVEVALAERVGATVPVPEVVAADTTGDSAGEPVLLSRFAPGAMVGSLVGDPGVAPPASSPAVSAVSAGDAAGIGRAVGAALAAVGTVTFPKPGFFDGPALDPGPHGMEPAEGLPAFIERCLGSPHAAVALRPSEHDALRRLAADSAPLLEAARGACHLVHSDFNPKNILAAPGPAGWRVTAVLDWEFAFSGSPLVDIGNMLRFGADLPTPYVDGFTDGFAAAGGRLPEGWRETSAALDLFALADFLTRPAGDAVHARVVALLRRRLAVA